MNVTVKLPDELIRAARHRAVDESKSLSAWLADLVRRELEHDEVAAEGKRTISELLTLKGAPDWFFEKEFPLEDRRAGTVREFFFED